MNINRSIERVGALVSPRNIVVVGASDRPGSWPATVWKTVHEHGFKSPIYAVNPNRDAIGDKPCYRTFDALPEKPDHVVMLTPAPAIPDALAEAAKAGARSATVFAAGYGEDGGPEGKALAARLRKVIADTGIAVQGPNCTGNIIGFNGLCTLVDHRKLVVGPGPVALIGQSGGVLLYANHILQDRGIQPGALISSGNEIDMSCADYIAYMADEPRIQVIFCYLESVKDVGAFKAACARARDAGKPVILFKIGSSEEGREAASTHTGALAGSAEAFDAVMQDYGVVRVDSLDDAIEAIEIAVHLGVPIGPRVGALSLSGAYRGILVDGAAGSGLTFPKLAPDVEGRLAALLSTGSSAGNPADGGFTVLTSVDKYVECVDILCDDPNLDVLILQAELPRETGMAAHWEERFQRIHDLVARRGKKLAFISMFSRMFTDYSREVRAALPKVAFVQETRKSVAAFAALAKWSERAKAAKPVAAAPSGKPPAIVADLKARLAKGGTLTLNENDAKAVIAAYGIGVPRETVAKDADSAAAAADKIGYPVVLKALSDKLTHKSDAGGVLIGLADAAAVRAGVETIKANVKRYGFAEPLDGFLVCEQVSGGTELVFGAQRDPEVGPVVMAGAGGILLELMKDVAFAPVPLSPAEAAAKIEGLRTAKLLKGYRGSAAHDIDALADALSATARLAQDLGDALESIDINPIVSRPGKKPVALDAVIVLRGKD
ncbi:MAG TPA: acetate--CoA ligase family protein [Pseudolabrys sp.]|nr:acetate--CoA ligase family protein [Pseudolabrys sp.]